MIKLTLSPEKLDIVMRALTQQPWVAVNEVIQDLVKQANNQPPAEVASASQEGSSAS